MAGDGNLHINEAFEKAKRNLVWFCSFAIVLYFVHFPKTNNVGSPMLGAGAELDVAWLRLFAMVACCYAFIGYFRQMMNVDRINSQALYTTTLNTIQERLERLSDQFELQCIELKAAFDKATPINFIPADEVGEVANQWLASNVHDLARMDRILEGGVVGPDRRPMAPEGSNLTFKEEWGLIKQALEGAGRRLVTKLSDEARSTELAVAAVNSIVGATNGAIDAIYSMKGEFEKLSDQIRREDKTFYNVYDKFVPMAMFTLAICLSLMEVLMAAAEVVDHPPVGWLATQSTLTQIGVACAALLPVLAWATSRLLRPRIQKMRRLDRLRDKLDRVAKGLNNDTAGGDAA